MKNIFKFMGIALMACSFTMVACSKDDDKKSDTPDVNIDAAIAVTFDGTVWTSDEVMDYTALSTDNLVKFDIYKDAQAEIASIQFVCLPAVNSYSFANSNYYAVYHDGTHMYNQPNADGSIVITAFDAQAKTLTGVISATFDTKELAVVLDNAKWAE